MLHSDLKLPNVYFLDFVDKLGMDRLVSDPFLFAFVLFHFFSAFCILPI